MREGLFMPIPTKEMTWVSKQQSSKDGRGFRGGWSRSETRLGY